MLPLKSYKNKDIEPIPYADQDRPRKQRNRKFKLFYCKIENLWCNIGIVWQVDTIHYEVIYNMRVALFLHLPHPSIHATPSIGQ